MANEFYGSYFVVMMTSLTSTVSQLVCQQLIYHQHVLLSMNHPYYVHPLVQVSMKPLLGGPLCYSLLTPIYVNNPRFFFLNIIFFTLKDPFTPSFTHTISTDFLTSFTTISMNSSYLTPNISSAQHSLMSSCQSQLCSYFPGILVGLKSLFQL
jgi:hypothetical protein